MTPRCLLVGHTAPVLCLTHASINADNAFFVSSSENGYEHYFLINWDIEICIYRTTELKLKIFINLPSHDYTFLF